MDILFANSGGESTTSSHRLAIIYVINLTVIGSEAEACAGTIFLSFLSFFVGFEMIESVQPSTAFKQPATSCKSFWGTCRSLVKLSLLISIYSTYYFDLLHYPGAFCGGLWILRE